MFSDHQAFAKYAGKDLTRWMCLSFLSVAHDESPNLPGLVQKVYSRSDPPSLDSITVKVRYGGRIVREFSAMEFLRVHSVIHFRPQVLGGFNPLTQTALPSTQASGNEKASSFEESRRPPDSVSRRMLNQMQRDQKVKQDRQPPDTPTKEPSSARYLGNRVFHMTKISNFASIVERGFVWSDSEMRRLGITPESIADEEIKQKRRERIISLDNRDHPANSRSVGDFVPFYFCTHTPMLYTNLKENLDPDFRQCDLVFLVASIGTVCHAANTWCFTDGHAIQRATSFFSRVEDLERIDWDTIEARTWKSKTDQDMKRRRQAEFLVLEDYPFFAIEIVAGRTSEAVQLIKDILYGSEFKPNIEARPEWYFQEDLHDG